jgi:4'-phosphopantetheinyl transferase
MRIEQNQEWRSSAATALATTRIDTWSIGLDVDDETYARAFDLLAIDERERAARFVFPVHRRRFVVARAALREILARQLGVAAADVAFRYTPLGKPELVSPRNLRFSVTHSGDRALIAVGNDVSVGIDIECIQERGVDIDGITRSFHPRERQALAESPAQARLVAFYRCWVRKEAVLKALGVGLTGGLDCFAVSVGTDARLLWADPAWAGCAEWTLIALDGEGYAAALATRDPAAQVVLKDWPLEGATGFEVKRL